ncbi:MAG TPA: ABC transporter substrate-binding protein, partial [Anaerolineae bacterium]|nr:ABC transporter substrate-binding protein [Anaerolineae bacterium]
MKTFHFLKSKEIYPLLLLVVLLLLVTACTGAAASPVERPPLKVSWNYWPGSYPIIIAQERGLFEKHGVKVEPILVEYESHAPDFIAKKTDGALFALADALVIDAREPDSARVVLTYDESAGADVVVANADIANIADLKNKRIGASLGSFGELLVRTMLASTGLTLDDVTLVNVGPEAVPQAMSASIQAGFTFEPHLSEAVAQGHHIIFSSSDTPGLIVDVA